MPVRRSSVRPSACSSNSTFRLFRQRAARPARRFFPALALGAAALLLPAVSAHAATQTLTVNKLADSNDGSCDSTTCSLRDAITQANLDTGDTIQFSVTGTITLTSNLPGISQSVTITGPSTGGVIISGANTYSIFNITSSSATVAISGLTVANGAGSASSGGILNTGTLTVSDSTIRGNSASGASSEGGGITNYGTLTVTNSTFTGNSAASGGAIFNGQNNTLTVRNSTFYGNTGGGAIFNYTGSTMTVTNSVLTGDSGGECSGFACPANGSNGNVVGVTAALLPLGNYGGTTESFLPQPGSAAICAGLATDVPGGVTTDQRGFALNAANCSNGGVDAGAVQTAYLMVTTATDSNDGSCTSTTCSLRDAIIAANTAGGDIGFKSSLKGSTLTLASAPPSITGAVNIMGLGADQLTVSGGNSSTVGAVFSVSSGAQVSIYGLTITGGKNAGSGGGIASAGVLTVTASAISSSTANNGGGIYSAGTLAVTGTTISGDTATLQGGGIYSTGTLRVTNSTFSANTASGTGGGALATSGTAVVTNSTFSSNAATSGSGGAILNGGVLTASNSIFSDNSAGSAGAGISNSSTANLSNSVYHSNKVSGSEDDCNGCTSNANAVTASSEPLAALGSYGGATRTLLPLPITTGAICAGSSSLATDANGGALTTDQRGFAVGVATYCASGALDAGAVQTNYQSAQFTNNTGYIAQVNQVVSPSPILSITENGQNVGGIPVTLTLTGSGTPTGLGPVTTVAGTGATFSNIKVDTAGAADTLFVSLPAGTGSITASANLEIDGAVTLSPATGALTGGSVGTAYSTTITASGGKGQSTFSVSTGTLPNGVTLNTSTGVLSGTPTKAGNFSFSIQATDTRSATGSASYTLAVSQASTLVTVTSKDGSQPSGTSSVGDSVTFTASLTPVGPGVTFANGVLFTLDGSTVAACAAQPITVATNSGTTTATATCGLSTLTKGTHSMVATYPTGDANYGPGASGDFTQTVNLSSTSVAVTSSKSPSNVDDSVTFTATVTNTSGSGVPTGGTVAFTSDGTGLSGCGAVALVPGSGKATATCTTSSLTTLPSPHSIVATYSGDSTTYDTSTSTAFSQTVSKAATAVTVTSSGASGVNQQVMLTATVSPTGPVALSSTGTMTFKDGSTTISGCSAVTITAATGQATCATSFTTAASHTIGAVYNGDLNYSVTANPSITTVTQTVSKANTTVAVASNDDTTGASGTTSSLNDSVTFTAIVTPYNGGTALTPPFTGAATLSGSVSFAYTGRTICSRASLGLDPTSGNYVATCTTSALPAGSITVTATYSGDTNYGTSNNNLTQTVSKVATSTTVISSSPGNSSTVNQPVTFTASVTPFTGATTLSGTVTFTAVNATTGVNSTLCNAVAITASTGVAACPVSSLTPGSYTVTASYGSDSNYSSSSGIVSQTVGQATTSISLGSSPNPSTINQQVTLTATVTAPSGTTALNGSVSFTDNGNAIADCPATPINPNAPTVTCKTSALAFGSHSLVASYGSDANFSNSSSTAVSQTVNAAPTTAGITSSAPANTSKVDQAVSFTATVSGASGAVQFSGTMAFTDNGNAISGCSALKVGAATGSVVCSTSSLLRGSHAIAATYTGDTNFATSSATLTQTVNPGASSVALVSSLDPSIALNPNNYHDLVALTATVSPSSGVALSGAVTFTDSGAPIAECQAAIPVDPATGTATCTTTSLGFGSHTILAAYNGDNNFIASSGSITQAVQDYTLTASPTNTVTVSQRLTNNTDPFSPQAITVEASPIAGFTGQLALSCNVVPLSAATGAVPPACNLGSSTLAITTSATQQPVSITIDAGVGSTPVATPGTYNVSVIGVDSTTGLTRASAAFTVNVRYQAPPLTIVSGATSGNSSTVDFTLPANVGVSDILCASVTGPTLTSSVAPVALSMGCTFSPSTIPPTSTSQDVLVNVTVSTGATTIAQSSGNRTAIVMAGMLGVPLLLLLGFMPSGRSSRKVFLRFLAIAFAVVMVLQGTGCGGGQFTAPPSVSGQTPPGSYTILVEGTGTDHQVYQAVVQVNVTR